MKSPDPRGWLCLLAFIFFLCSPSTSLAHDVADHLDPELLTGWRTWLHLTIQWVHLVAFALWMGLTVGTLVLRVTASLDHLLYSSWVLFLIMLTTGIYNSEWSAGISDKPSLFLLPVLEKIPYGVTYTLALAVKVGLYGLTVLMTLIITIMHLRSRMREAALRKTFLIAGSAVGVLMALAAAIVLFYHEVADLWPTPVHSLGGVMTPTGPLAKGFVGPDSPPPNDFLLLATKDAWIDIVLRSFHLLGFGVLLGGMVIGAFVRAVSTKRFLWYVWILLTVQILSGIGNMVRWTSFDPVPYIWNLDAVSHIRFGRIYVSLMAVKHGWVLLTVGLFLTATVLHRRHGREFSVRGYALAGAIAALVISYIMMMVLLVHEGVDHAL